jgi:hypothetical protein
MKNEKFSLVQGSIASFASRRLSHIHSLADVEFSISSQWGEDGIIDWLVEQIDKIPDSFIEFGVENYTESNTRFLLQHRNWKGLIIDGSKDNIQYVRHDPISWRHNLTSVHAFITRENINEIISASGFSNEIGLLSIDIDGNDYWVWESIDVLKPYIVVAEYNSSFGDLLPLSIPYDANFVRGKSHFSNLYYGASIAALKHLAERKGYVLIGSNSAGSNAFFVRNDYVEVFYDSIVDKKARPSRFRESRDRKGHLTLISGIERSRIIGDMPVEDIQKGMRASLASFGNLYSECWEKLL